MISFGAIVGFSLGMIVGVIGSFIIFTWLLIKKGFLGIVKNQGPSNLEKIKFLENKIKLDKKRILEIKKHKGII